MSLSLYSKMISSTVGSISSNYERTFVVNITLSFIRVSLSRLFLSFLSFSEMLSFDSPQSFCIIESPLLRLSLSFASPYFTLFFISSMKSRAISALRVRGDSWTTYFASDRALGLLSMLPNIESYPG